MSDVSLGPAILTVRVPPLSHSYVAKEVSKEELPVSSESCVVEAAVSSEEVVETFVEEVVATSVRDV